MEEQMDDKERGVVGWYLIVKQMLGCSRMSTTLLDIIHITLHSQFHEFWLLN